MNLTFQSALDYPDLLAAPVYEFLKAYDCHQRVKVAEINPDFADGELLSRAYAIPYEMEVNCLVVEGKRQEKSTFAAIIVPYGKRANTNATIKKPMNASKVGFAQLEEVLQKTQMEFGSITPLGLPADWKILMDGTLMEQENLVMGSGLVRSKLLVPTEFLTTLPCVEVLENLAKD